MADTKICAVCKQDCSTAARTKDGQGRYFHKTCFDKLVAKKKALKAQQARAPAAVKPATVKPAAPVWEEAPAAVPLDDDWAAPAVASPASSCPSCGAPLLPEAILCTGCGFNRVTGQRIATNVAPRVVVERAKGGPSRFAGVGGGFVERLKAPWLFGIVSLAFFAVLALAAKASPAAFLLFIGVHTLYRLVFYIWLIVAGFQDGATSGILCLICGPYGLYFCFAKQDNAHLKWGVGVGILTSLIMIPFGLNPLTMRALPGQNTGGNPFLDDDAFLNDDTSGDDSPVDDE